MNQSNNKPINQSFAHQNKTISYPLRLTADNEIKSTLNQMFMKWTTDRQTATVQCRKGQKYVDNCHEAQNTRAQLSLGLADRTHRWCTLATCVHNCPSMMFRTRCCLRPKCKRSYLLIYIISDTS